MVKRMTMAAVARMARRAEAALGPTPEQMAKARFVESEVVELVPGRVTLRIGRAWRRRPRFETIEGLSAVQAKALRAYRAIFDASERSPVKSALDIRPRGSGGAEAALARLERIAEGGWMLEAVERSVLDGLRRIAATDRTPALQVLRDVALADLSFAEAAIRRFGGREVSRIDVKSTPPRHYTTIEVKSGTHRTRVKEEFFLALDLLVEALETLNLTKLR